MDVVDLKHPPKFNGQDFSVYKERVLLWSETTDIATERQAPLLLLNCVDKAADLISSIDREKLKAANGVKYFLDFVQALYGEVDNLRKLISVYSKYRNLTRGRSGATEYVSEFLKLRSELSSLKVTTEMAQAFHLISGADMTDTEYSQFLTIVSSKGIDYSLEVIANQIKQVITQNPESTLSSNNTVSVQFVSNKSKGKGKGKRARSGSPRFRGFRDSQQYYGSRKSSKGSGHSGFHNDNFRPHYGSKGFGKHSSQFSTGKGKQPYFNSRQYGPRPIYPSNAVVSEYPSNLSPSEPSFASLYAPNSAPTSVYSESQEYSQPHNSPYSVPTPPNHLFQ